MRTCLRASVDLSEDSVNKFMRFIKIKTNPHFCDTTKCPTSSVSVEFIDFHNVHKIHQIQLKQTCS